VTPDRSENGRSTLLVGISNPETLDPLLHLASILADAGPFEVVLAHVVTVAEQRTLDSGRSSPEAIRARDFLRRAVRSLAAGGIEARAVVQVARSVDEGLLSAAESRGARLILVGYSEGHGDGEGEKEFDRVMHRVAHGAETDVVVAKLRQEEMASVLVPVAPQPRLEVTGLLCRALHEGDGASIRFLHVIEPGEPESEAEGRLRERLDAAGLGDIGDVEVVAAPETVDAIAERAADYDLVIVGPATRPSLMNALFGSISERIAEGVPCSALLIRSA